MPGLGRGKQELAAGTLTPLILVRIQVPQPQSPALIMIAGYAAFVPGLAIVYFHNRWMGGWPVLVTVMGWLSLVVGLLRMVFPTQIAALTTKIAPSAAGVFPVVAVVFLLIGGFLSFKAFGRE